MSPAPQADRSRLEWLDLFRGTAVVLMIETHVANTTLTESAQQSWWFARLSYANGLVAPAFLLIAGYVMALGMRRSSAPGAFPWKKLRRLGSVALIGYALHFPWPALGRGLSIEFLRLASTVDVLQCLAVSLGTLVLVQHFARRYTLPVVGLLLLAAVFAAPLSPAWRTGFPPVDAYLNGANGSLFPLFPWAGFVFGGYLMTALGLRWRLHLPAAGILMLGAFLLPNVEPAAIEPAFFFERLACLVLLIPCFAAARDWMRPRVLLLAGRESLAMYVVHLLILHIDLAGFGIAARLGKTLSPAAAAVLFCTVLAATLGIAWLYGMWKTLRKR